ncbi:RNA polymerase sigma factor [Erythrobacter alti]|uniref:RNA polymerase sigma factor n=1 Tax=Erythrobacter alti TaxID=1896145 RepID=UPI0030F4445E
MVWGGDRSAMDELARRWHPRLLRSARRMLGEDEPAHAVTQECWVAIIRGIHRLSNPERFAPWAFTILRRKCADAIRSQQARRLHDGDGEHAEIADHGDPGGSVSILQAFAALAPEQRLAAHLYFVEGLTLAEIADVQDIPTGTAKSRLFHARRKLKVALSGEEK